MNIRIDPTLVPDIKAYCDREGLKNVSAGVHRLIVLSLGRHSVSSTLPTSQPVVKVSQPVTPPKVSVPSFGGFGGGLKL